MKKQATFFLALALLLALTACTKHPAPTVSRSNYMLDTLVHITLYNWEDASTIDRAMDEIRRLESLLSVDYAGSDLDRLYRAAGVQWVDISPESEELLRKGKALYALTEGKLDITAGPLIDLWSIKSSGTGHYPSEAERQAAQAHIAVDALQVEEGRAFLADAGMKVNLGAIAKGYIADRVKALLQAEGVEHAVIDLGRNILLIGGKPEGTPFHVGIQDPLGESGAMKFVLALEGKTAVTAGVDERFFEHEGKRYHHILDPQSGFPAATGLASVTIVMENSAMADALATSCLLLGVEKSMLLLESIDGVEACFIASDGQTQLTQGFAQYIAEET